MLRATAAVLAGLLVLGTVTGTAHADQWSDQVRACKKALSKTKPGNLRMAARSLAGMDHPAALELLLKLYAREKSKRDEFEDLFMPPGRVEDLERVYVRLMPEFHNVRSVRYVFERIDDKNAHVAELCAWALKDRDGLHAVEDLLRERFRRALKRREFDLARRYLELLKHRIHVRDAAWIRTAAEDLPKTNSRDAAEAALIIQQLRAACPDLRLRHEENPDDDVYGEGIKKAAELNTALDEIPDVPAGFTFTGWLALKDLRPWWDLVHQAYQERIRRLLAQPAFAALDETHDAAVALAHWRMKNHDSYFFAKDQSQRFDKRAGRRAKNASSLVVSFALPAVVRETRLLSSMKAWLTKRGDGRRIIGAPYHADLITLNAGRITRTSTIAFTPRDAERIRLTAEVRTFNETAQGVRPLERANAVLVNDYRADYGLLPLRLDAHLALAARRHSSFQRQMGQLAHTFTTVKEPHGRTPRDRMRKAGYPAGYAGGENVYQGIANAAAAFAAWRSSPGHRRNMLQPAWTEIGVGVAGAYWTQNFGTEPYDQDHQEGD